LDEACGKTGWQVHAFCLMRNHFHLVVETPQANLIAGMQWLLGTYTARFNRRHKVFGHLFGGRYKSLLVDGSGGGYLKTVCDYVHLNPARAKLLQAEERLSAFAWSSYPLYLSGPSRRPAWLRVDRLLGPWGVRREDGAGRRQFQRGMEQRRQEKPEDLKRVRRGWCLGDDGFREKLLARLGEGVGEHHDGEEIGQSEEAKAEGMVTEGLAQAGWGESELELRRKADGAKVELARRLRRETTLGWRWIARRLHMGHWRSAANAVRLKQ
jgi:REP element-mobilizing transposase RayT